MSLRGSINGGETWEVQFADTTVRYDIFFINNKIGWATGIFDGENYNWSRLIKTTDGGITWKMQADKLVGTGDDFRGVYFINEEKGWLTGGPTYSVITTNGGETWTRDSSLALVKKLTSVDSLHLWGLS